MRGLMSTVAAAPLPPSDGFAGIGFESIPASLAPVADQVAVPPGYTVQVLVSWGDPIMPGAPAWAEDATQDAAAQAMQFGMHNDGMHFFPVPGQAEPSNTHGLLCVNNEYTHEEILHGSEGLSGGAGPTIDKIRKSQAAHGLSVIEIKKVGDHWTVVKDSTWGRRITGNTQMRVSGSAAGHALLQSKQFDITPTESVETGVNDGYTAFGTLNNCAHGYTPWGTYLSCEENWNGYFAAPTNGANIDAAYADQVAEILNGFTRYGISDSGFGYEWHVHDPRFDADYNPLEPHLYGWVVEVDPADPQSVPVKRTALGRFKRESAQVAVSAESGSIYRVAFYMGDDERNEYIYKFVCEQPFDPSNPQANRDLLDNGTLYVAKFTDAPGSGAETYRGQWIPLSPDTMTVIADSNHPGQFMRLRDLDLFAGVDDAEVQAKILIKTRQAGDAVGATMMDRPEWTALRTYWDPEASSNGYGTYTPERPLEVYCTLTNNSRRGGGDEMAPGVTSGNSPDGSTEGGSARPAVDPANPRPDNDYGHIIRWREDGHVVTALEFEWDVFVLCGDTATTKTLDATYDPTDLSGAGYPGNIVDIPDGSADFGAPDGLWFDPFGRLWAQTDQAGDGEGDWINIGANTMVCADPNTKEVRRFLTSPPHCEVTGVINTPDGKTMFVGIQHPGEDAPASDPAQYSNWPQAQFSANSSGTPLPNTPGLSRPRSSVLVITKEDGGVIGT